VDPKSKEHSFSLTAGQLRNSTIDKKSSSDIIIKLENGETYEIGLDEKDYQDTLNAIHSLQLDYS